MIFNLPPQFGQWSMSISKTRLSSLAQLMRAGAPCACASSVEASVARSAGLGMILPRNFALGTSMPWKRIRCKRERGTSAASRCMNSSGAMTIWVVPSLNALFSCNTTSPARLRCNVGLRRDSHMMRE